MSRAERAVQGILRATLPLRLTMPLMSLFVSRLGHRRQSSILQILTRKGTKENKRRAKRPKPPLRSQVLARLKPFDNHFSSQRLLNMTASFQKSWSAQTTRDAPKYNSWLQLISFLKGTNRSQQHLFVRLSPHKCLRSAQCRYSHNRTNILNILIYQKWV
jgi:hypothetical protein